MLLLALALPLCALAEQQEAQAPAAALRIAVTQAAVGACTLEIPSAEPDGQAELAGDDLLAAQTLADEVNVRLAQRLMTQDAERVSLRAGADTRQTAKVWQDGRTASVALTWVGTQADGLDGYSVLPMALDLTTGGEIGIDALFADPDGARAAMEEIIGGDVLDAMSADSGIRLAALKVDGGAAANNYLLQTQADISNAPVERPCSVETTALGAAYLAGLAVGFWSGPEELTKNRAIDKLFVPDIPEAERRKRLRGWHKAVRCAYNWARDDDEEA